ncbi:DUF2798 domain-containing protein [Paenibacillus durus]|uniref:DUF2798 domain-containing protein n=1 Tax=Paenibacillus durus ATCC 35681 TaxID=1333534 RepID=A0A0F7F669_PAEDU|nr:DUF2798 domain-containing protein [Paenibacillus durus]AKG33244.1 hypothetical protein VK70_00295 [Paenibacillus durus ATCC 35681]
MRIHAKYRQLLFISSMSITLTFIMSGIMTYVLEGGLIPHFMSAWMKDWGIAFVIAFGLNFFLPVRIRRFANRFKKGQLVVYVLTISFIMTFILSFVLTAIAMRGFIPGFAGYWMGAWRVAFSIVFVLNFFLPQWVGRIVGTLIMKPANTSVITGVSV